MDALDALTSRISVSRLVEPAPDDEMLALYFAAAHRAPDHGAVRPWRFIIIRGDARHRLGKILAETLLGRDPTANPGKIEKEKAKPLRAPMIIVVAAKINADRAIPPLEQILAAGAAAQNILLAAHATGFGAIWRTGTPARDPQVKRALDLDPADEIVGFIYLGTPESVPVRSGNENPQDYVSEWTAIAS